MFLLTLPGAYRVSLSLCCGKLLEIKMDAKEEAILGKDAAKHWYYVSKGRALRAIIGDTKVDEVLDVGAGSGIFSRQLIEAGLCDRATCVDPAYPNESTEYLDGHPLSFVRSIDNHDQKLVLMMDVLEHVEDDVQLLKYYTHSLPDDGKVLITVPAFQFLWSGHDVFLEHHRRYTRSMLNNVVRAADLEVIRTRYFFGLLFPIVAAMRVANARKLRYGITEPKSSLKRHNPNINHALILFHDLERQVIFPANVLAGLTLFCLAHPKL